MKARANSRGWHYTEGEPKFPGAKTRLQDFGSVPAVRGAGYIVVRTGALENAVHEYAHRLQSALPELDALFKAVHRRRTAGEPLESLRAITGIGYKADE